MDTIRLLLVIMALATVTVCSAPEPDKSGNEVASKQEKTASLPANALHRLKFLRRQNQAEKDDQEKTNADNFIEGGGIDTNTGETKFLKDVARTRDTVSAQQVSSDDEPAESGDEVASTREKTAKQSTNGLLRFKRHRREASEFLPIQNKDKTGGKRQLWGEAEEEEEDDEDRTEGHCEHLETKRAFTEEFRENNKYYKEARREGKIGITKTFATSHERKSETFQECGERSCEGSSVICATKKKIGWHGRM